MDEKMEDAIGERLPSHELDFDYEFDAPFYFDFCRNESPSEALETEQWFETAATHPPSPFTLRDNLHVENVNTHPKSADVEHTNSITSHSDFGMRQEFSVVDKENRDYEEITDRGFLIDYPIGNLRVDQHEEQTFTSCVLDHFLNDSISADSHDDDCHTKGWALYNQISRDVLKTNSKSFSKALFSKGSTLMRPTASQLAKQNRPLNIKGSSQHAQRFQKPLVQKIERGLGNPCGNESQAAKRQKLDGGNLLKVFDLKQQTRLIHKVPKKNGLVNLENSRLKLTIPREPELETAQRAQRLRSKSSKRLEEPMLAIAPKFKARPLNRKILEAPSLPLPQKSTPRLPEFQEFHLMTSQRAIKHSSAASSSFPSCNSSAHAIHDNKATNIQMRSTDSLRLQCQASAPSQLQKPKVIDDLKREGSEAMPKFRARHLNKKIFSSKGDIGVFRTNKRETTIPMEFDFSTDKRFQHNPPIDLFNKLSLTSDIKQNATCQTRSHLPSRMPVKGSKENMMDSLKEEHKITHVSEEKQQMLKGKQMQCGSDVGRAEIRPRNNLLRSTGIR